MASKIPIPFAHTLYNPFPLEDGKVYEYVRFYSYDSVILYDKGILQM